jgi:hypothetical protein
MSSQRTSARSLPRWRRRRGPIMIRVLASMVFLVSLWARPAAAGDKKETDNTPDADTEHLFGFTEGSDIGERGEKEFEAESIGRFGRQGGSYAAVSTALEAKYTPADYFRMSGRVIVASYSLSGVPGFSDHDGLTLQGVALDLRYRVLDREKAPFGLTLAFEPLRGFADQASGAPADQSAGTFSLLVDKEIVPKRVFAAFNLLYEAEVTRVRGTDAIERESVLGARGAVAAQVQPGFYWGAELRYLRHYDGPALGSFTGDAVYAGPTLYAKLPRTWSLSAAWNVQIAGGRNGLPGSLDLADFERHQAKLRLGFTF